MKHTKARIWLVKYSLAMLGALGFFLIAAPATHFPLSFDQSISILQIAFPIFLGYLSTAIVFITTDKQKPVPVISDDEASLVNILIVGPLLVVFGLLVVSFSVFGFVNWPREVSGNIEFDFNLLSNITALVLSIHTATTSAIVAWLFKIETDNAD